LLLDANADALADARLCSRGDFIERHGPHDRTDQAGGVVTLAVPRL
jgi:hypothetical protein